MKKRLLLAFAGFALFSGAMAQSSGVGLRLGGNYSTLSGYEDFEPSSKILPSMGLTGFLQGRGNWSFSADLLFSQRGVEYKKVKSDSLQTETELYDETLNYIEIPVLFHYSFLSDSSAFRPRVFFGPSLNVRASSNRNLSYKKVNAADSVLLESTADQDLKNTYTPLDYGFIVGAGITYKINAKFVATADVRLNYGLMDIREYLSESSPSIRNRNYCFHIGVYYLLGQ